MSELEQDATTVEAIATIIEVENVREIAQRMPHRQHVPEELRHDPKAGCLLGGLALNGHITNAQYQAGVRFRSTSSSWLGMWEGDDEHEFEVERAICRDHRELHELMLRTPGVGVRGLWAVRRLCVFDDPITEAELPMVRRAFNAMLRLGGAWYTYK